MNIFLSLDDFTIVHNRLDLLLKLKEHFPNFKISLFTIPVDTKMDYGPYLLRAEALKEIKQHLDWIQLIPHGLTHDGREAGRWTKEQFKKEIAPKIEEAFNKDGLPFVKGFKAPHYTISVGVVEALKEMGWWIGTKEGYALHEPWPQSDILKLRGHVYGCADDLEKNIDKLMRLPKDVTWHFITEYTN